MLPLRRSGAHSSSDCAGAVPGLKSVAMAKRAPLARSSFAFGSFWPSVSAAAGSRTPTVPAAASARQSSSLAHSR
jgi:hypothetical protein